MSAQFAKDQVSFAPTATMSARTADVFAPAQEGAVAKTVRAVGTWLSDKLKRRAVTNELAMLSDHELADIGLSRADIPRVFDRAFVATRSAPRA
jgi:uncharacterized protein YjiS (DUF1127 family)